MRVEPKAIVRRLNTTCTAMLEAAVAHAAGSRYYEIVPEHLLFALFGGGGGKPADRFESMEEVLAKLEAGADEGQDTQGVACL